MADTSPQETRDIEPELYEGLGRVVVVWSSIESLIAEFLSFLLEANPGNMYVLNQTVSVDTQIKWVKTLAEIKFVEPNTAERLNDLFARLDEARLDRNGYVHGLWSTLCEPGAVLIQTVRLNRAEMVKGELTTRADLDELVVRLEEIRHEIIFLGHRLGFLGSERRNT